VTRNSRAKYIGVAGFALVSAIIAYVLSGWPPNDCRLPRVDGEYNQTILGAAVNLNAGEYQVHEIDVPQNAVNAKITACILVGGATGSEVRMMLLNQESYAEWQQNQSVSHVVIDRNLSRPTNWITNLKSGEVFYLVFDNKFGSLPSKPIYANIELVYDK